MLPRDRDRLKFGMTGMIPGMSEVAHCMRDGDIEEAWQ
jgi:hypothetical protein